MSSAHGIPRDVLDVTQAAGLLDTTEYHLFDIAYLRWYGRPSDPRVLEDHFTDYMFKSIVPHWVRHLCREILERARAGRLRSGDYGVAPLRLSRRTVWRGRIYSLLMLLVLVLFLLAGGFYTELVPFLESCYFPPCY